jgi:hypothetical protein
LRISGETYKGVPQKVLLSSPDVLLTAHPKSHSFTFPYSKLTTYISHHDILRLDISVQDVQTVQIAEGFADLLHDKHTSVFRNAGMLFYYAVQLAL